jgi:hypothetical protein
MVAVSQRLLQDEMVYHVGDVGLLATGPVACSLSAWSSCPEKR